MKIFKYLTVILAAALAATGCYDDKGSYYTGSWTSIAAVEGMSIPGTETRPNIELVEDETLSINPTVRFNPGVDASQFTYDWIMGGDTIASGLKLDWTVTRTERTNLVLAGYQQPEIGRDMALLHPERKRQHSESNDLPDDHAEDRCLSL